MKLLSVAVGVLLGLVLLTWLLLRGIGSDGARYAQALQILDDFTLADASLHRDVLQARAGLLRNYDPLVHDVRRMDDAVAWLRSYVQAEGFDTGLVDRLGAAVARQEELTERFKSNNALLQNSLSYVGLLSTDPAFGDQDAQLARANGALAAAILFLARNISPEAAHALQQRIDRLAAEAPVAGPNAEAVQALLAHARLLRALLPAVDATLKALVAAPSRQPLEATRALFADHHAAAESRARRFRLLLYLVSLLLFGALVRLGLRLRARVLALHRRAEFEYVVAKNSTRLINCPPAETEARLKQVLGDLGHTIGVERAYVVVGEDPIQVYAWCAQGAAYPPDWPEQALVLSTRLGATGLDIVTVPDTADLPPGEVKDALTAVAARAWACVPLIRPGRVRGIMGFDRFRPARKVFFPLPVVRLAGDAIANAIERESLERDRAKLATRLERARRMQTVGSLASGIAHNFNSIIAVILGYSEMVEAELVPRSKSAQYIDEVRRAAERGRDLIDSILTFGRRPEAQVRPVPV
ncbi:MAG: hypothetical protein JOY66_04690, partial [Acetobacteraceae bacterium]|nr:hypothetical protein [Acetobacteraceae bacterium]